MKINATDNGYSISYEIRHATPILSDGKLFKIIELDYRDKHGWDRITCWMHQSNGIAVHYGQMWYGSVFIGEELLQ